MNDLTNPNDAINLATSRYQTALSCLDNPKIKLSALQVLEILATRDELQPFLKEDQSIPPDLLSRILVGSILSGLKFATQTTHISSPCPSTKRRRREERS